MNAIDQFAKRVIERAQRNLGATRTIRGKKRRRVTQGGKSESLINNLTYSLKKTKDGGALMQFGAKGKAKQYADVIERGRRPGSKRPPMQAIIDWMKVKPIRLQRPGGGFVKSTESRIRSAAFLIARSIGEKGIEGIHYYEEAIKDELADTPEEFRQLLVEQINEWVAKQNAKNKKK